MKKIFSIFLILCLVSTLISINFAAGIFVPPGAGSESMGGAYVAIADDATAIYWNPAGLTQLEDAGVEVTIASTHLGVAKSVKGKDLPVDIEHSKVRVDDYDAVVFVNYTGYSTYEQDITDYLNRGGTVIGINGFYGEQAFLDIFGLE